MKAVLLKKEGGPEQLYVGDTDVPTLKPGELLVKVHTTALNRADTLQRQGNYPVPPGASKIIGLECAGEIADIGDTNKYKVGDRVMCLLGGGGYAQYVAVPVGCCMPIPSHLNWTEAGAIPEVWLTAYQLMRYIGGLSEGQTVLIHAGASGVGTAGIQLAKLFKAKSIITAGKAEKLDFCKSLGADAAFNYKDKAFGAEVKQWLSDNGVKAGVNVVLDPVGASHFADNVDVLGVDGKYVLFGLMGGTDVQLNLGKVLQKRIQLIGSTLRARSNDYKANLVAEFSREVLPAFQDKSCKPVVYKEMQMEDIVEAHKLMESDVSTGKIVIHVPQ